MDSPKSPFDDPDSSAANQPASATGVFGTVSAPHAADDEDDLLKSLMKGAVASTPNQPVLADAPSSPTPAPAAAAAPVPPPPAPSAPGEFTQMLQTLSTMPPAPAAPASSAPGANPPAPKQGSDLAGVFKQVAFEKSPAPPPSVPAPAPLPSSTPAPQSPSSGSAGSQGGFTQ